MKRKAHVVWRGDGENGSGELTTGSGALKNLPYDFKMRFKNDDGKLGTNPEELIAAAHAGCFNMKLSFVLNENGFSPDHLETVSELTFVDGVVEQSSSDRLQHCLCHGLGRGCRLGISQQQPTVQRTGRSLCRADPSDPSASATALLVFRSLSRSAIRTAGSPRGIDPSLQSGDHGDGTQSQRGVRSCAGWSQCFHRRCYRRGGSWRIGCRSAWTVGSVSQPRNR